ncbi:DUF262 domain-containing protein [Photobacterium sp. S4TG1]|uniref:DUF262 domain-containing protein n=1 Tax=Photobacterium sp. S4TG1 TaxID=3114587 RepID=UPI002E19BCDB|nr:DUF262 domain-containing protein [Photobacterium sp. S4TG1]
MNYENIINDITSLIGLTLSAINASTSNISIDEIDVERGFYYVVSKSTNKKTKRNIKEIKLIFEALDRDGYCNVEEVLQGSSSSRNHPETIFANLPYVQFFKYERRKHLVLRDFHAHKFGATQEVPKNEQKKLRDSILEYKKFSQGKFASELDEIVSELKSSFDELHIKSPGLLIESNIFQIVKKLETINDVVKKTSVNMTSTKNKNIQDYNNELIRDNNFDMSDLVDLSSFTGVVDDELNLDVVDDEDIPNKNAQEIKVPYIRRQTPSLFTLYERLHYDEIEIQPDYQRGDRIWDDNRKSKLIESIFMGLPLPIFYFGERKKNDNWVVIDGLQRLTTIQDFMAGELTLKLPYDSPVSDLDGMNFKDFEAQTHRKYIRAIKEYEITAYIIDVEDENDENNRFIIELFHRINTYGVKLSDQEIRSAINFGNSVFYLKFVASSKTFTDATNDAVNHKRQKDLELCLGALSYMLYGFKDFNYNKYNDFLVETMRWFNNQDFNKVKRDDGSIDYLSKSPIIIDITSRFESSLSFCKEIFHENAFRKSIGSRKNDPISKTLFEALVSLFSNADLTQRKIIKNNKDKLIEILYDAIKNDSKEYSNWISEIYEKNKRGFNYSLSQSTGKKVTILYRFESLINIVYKATGCKLEIVPIVKELK